MYIKLLPIALIAACLLSCSKEKETSKKPSTPPDPKSHLIGTWHRQYYIEGFSQDTTFAGTDGYTYEYEFYSKDSVIYRAYHHGNLITRTRDTMHYYFDYIFDGVDSTEYIFIRGGSFYYNLSTDTLTLDGGHRDLPYALYTKN